MKTTSLKLSNTNVYVRISCEVLFSEGREGGGTEDDKGAALKHKQVRMYKKTLNI